MHGLRATDLPRELARHRSLSARASTPSSIIWVCAATSPATLWPMPTKRATGASTATSPRALIGDRAAALRRRAARHRTQGHGLRPGLHHHRFVPVVVSLGAVPIAPRPRSSCTRCSICVAAFRHFIFISDGKLHDVNILDQSRPRAGRLLRDGSRLHRLRALGPASTTPAASSSSAPSPTSRHNAATRTRWTQPPGLDLRPDHCAHRASTRSKGFETLRCGASASTTPKRASGWCFLTNNFALPALTIAQLYRLRWQVELFFKWIKQHLRIKAFYGTNRECREDANLDRRVGLRAGGHRQEAAQTVSASLYECYRS